MQETSDHILEVGKDRQEGTVGSDPMKVFGRGETEITVPKGTEVLKGLCVGASYFDTPVGLLRADVEEEDDVGCGQDAGESGKESNRQKTTCSAQGLLTVQVTVHDDDAIKSAGA